MKFILAKKQSMSQVFTEEGVVIPVTVLDAQPITVTQVKGIEKDGYNALQVGYGSKQEKRIAKPQKEHFKGLGNFAHLQEFRLGQNEPSSLSVGEKIDVSTFAPGDTVQVSAISKGKGFQSVIKLHNFKGGPRSHGQKHSEREPGSIGGGLRNKVPKGMKMAGRMGADRITVKNLKVVQVNTEAGLILISGAVPGRRGTLVEIRG
jgi:large subunit ribosomal protein L3